MKGEWASEWERERKGDEERMKKGKKPLEKSVK